MKDSKEINNEQDLEYHQYHSRISPNYAAVASRRLPRMPVFQFLMPLPWLEAVKWTINAQNCFTPAPKPEMTEITASRGRSTHTLYNIRTS
jgi:hypothetical protein